jgi:hydrogenase-1 operon protein HyaE
MDSDSALHPLLAQMISRHGFVRIEADELDAFAAPGHTLLVFTEDPLRYKETLDIAVIAPELAKAFGLRAAVLLPETARKVAPRFGFTRWPALVLLKDGRYVGAIDGLRNWDEYIAEMQRLLTADPVRAPSIGITVRGDSAAPCH